MDSTNTFNGKYLSHSGEVAFSDITAPVICLYFSAHWCPPCRNFTPALAKLYEEWNKDEKQIEVIFVTSDRDEDSFKEYYKTMPWLALPFGDSKIKELKILCDVKGIPMLVVVSKDGLVLNSDARTIVSNYGIKAIEEMKKLY